jgi:activator of HSP90 ATPase
MQPMDPRVTRRQIGFMLGGLGAALAHARNNKPGAAIHQEVDFNATPARIYEVLLDAKQFRAFSNQTAEVQPRAGEPFKLFGGRVEGRNIELVTNERIVQAWRPASWPAGVYSIVRFELVARGSGTRIVFDHTGFPEENREHLSQGWSRNYWDPLRKYLKA